MTITLKNSGSEVILCHGYTYAGTAEKHVGPLGSIRTEAEWTIRPKRPVGAADETPLDGGHAVWPFAFSVWIEFSTEDDCQYFVDTWAASLPRNSASLQIDYASGARTTRASAVLKKCVVQQYGTRAQVDYLFQTARPADTTPES